jgi:hypothetical protein
MGKNKIVNKRQKLLENSVTLKYIMLLRVKVLIILGQKILRFSS